MKKLWISGLVALSVGMPVTAQSAGAPKGTILTFVRGSCTVLVLAGKDITPECSPALVNAAYPTGASSFMFSIGNKAMVSFFGHDNPAVGDHAMVYLQRVTFKDSSTDNPSSEVSGTCTYSNPFVGRAVIECNADSRDGKFRAVFTTDGQPPKVVRL